MHDDKRQPAKWLGFGGAMLALVVVGLGSFFAGRALRSDRDGVATTQPTTQPATQPAGGGSETIYYCSMHPQVTSTDPDEPCPICGMDLIPKPTDDQGDDGDQPILRLSERSARLLDVPTMPVERRAIEKQVRFVGALDYDERGLADVVARAPSYVEQLHANYRWMPVRRGQPLAALDSPRITAAFRELLLVQKGGAVDRDAASLRAARARLDRLGVTSDQVDAILASGEAPRTYEMLSPVDGVIAELHVRQGEWLGEGGRLMRVADLSTLWLQLEAYETDLPWLRPGQLASFTVQALPGETFEGEVTFIDPRIEPRTRTARVRIEAPNPAGRLKPGMFARGVVLASLNGREANEVPLADADEGVSSSMPLVIPATAPLITGRRAVVYVRQPDAPRPTFEGRQVVLGPRAGDHYVVLEGLAEGEQVVMRGAFKIDSELQIRGRPSMMARAELFGEQPEAAPRIPADHPAHAVNPDEAPESFRRSVAEAFDHYLALTAALAADDHEAARQAVRAYQDHLLTMDAGALGDAAAKAWRSVDRELHAALQAMTEAEAIDGVRAQLKPLSDHTALAVQAFARGHVGAMFRVHCPMAFNDQGADWLQADEQIANPYFGASMPTCGVVEEDLLSPTHEHDESTAPPTEPAGQRATAGDPLDVCVVTGLPLDSMGGPVSYVYQGRDILLCCAACKPRFEADPETYLRKLEQASPGPVHQH